MPKTNKIRMQSQQPKVSAWNVSHEVLKTFDMYAMATGINKYEIVEQALIEYFKKHRAKKVITDFVNDGLII